MSISEFIGVLVAAGPIILLVWMFVKSEMDQAPIVDEHGKLIIQ